MMIIIIKDYTLQHIIKGETGYYLLGLVAVISIITEIVIMYANFVVGIRGGCLIIINVGVKFQPTQQCVNHL